MHYLVIAVVAFTCAGAALTWVFRTPGADHYTRGLNDGITLRAALRPLDPTTKETP